MKICVNDIKIAPPFLGEFCVCVFGKPSEQINQWISHWKLEVLHTMNYTNIVIPNTAPIEDMFDEPLVYDYVDGFSPNLNKHLHIGHLSNLVIAKALQGLKVGKQFIAIFGDTLTGNVKPDEALEAYQAYCDIFEYKVDKVFFASQMKLKDMANLHPGINAYAGTKVFHIGEERIVGIKSDGSSTYFYQDIALAQELNASTLYLTGLEQDNHFSLLQKLFPHTSHLGLGLILLDGKKMSSSEGNVIYLNDILTSLAETFQDDYHLVYNVLAGNILKSEPKSEKNIDTKSLSDVKLSMGMYISYTMARMHSAGLNLATPNSYTGADMKLNSLRAKYNLKPHLLFKALVEICEKINEKYKSHKIKNHPENQMIFQTLTSDMMLAVTELGLLPVYKI